MTSGSDDEAAARWQERLHNLEHDMSAGEIRKRTLQRYAGERATHRARLKALKEIGSPRDASGSSPSKSPELSKSLLVATLAQARGCNASSCTHILRSARECAGELDQTRVLAEEVAAELGSRQKEIAALRQQLEAAQQEAQCV